VPGIWEEDCWENNTRSREVMELWTKVEAVLNVTESKKEIA